MKLDLGEALPCGTPGDLYALLGTAIAYRTACSVLVKMSQGFIGMQAFGDFYNLLREELNKV